MDNIEAVLTWIASHGLGADLPTSRQRATPFVLDPHHPQANQQAALDPIFFFLNVPATTEIYTLSLHDALPIFRRITRTENILHRNFTRRQVAIQNRVASNIGISQSTFSVKVLNLF